MESPISLLGLELIVDDLDRALELFVGVLGFEVYRRGPGELVAGESAVVTDDRFAITLLQPTTSGDGPVLADRTPRVSQLVFGTDPAHLDELVGRAVESGMSLSPVTSGCYMKPEAVAGLVGIETSIVVTTGE